MSPLGAALLGIRRSAELVDRLQQGTAEKEARALASISRLQSVNGYCPSLSQLAADLALSKEWTRDIVNALRSAGIVAFEPRVGHSLRVAKPEELAATRERAWRELFDLLPSSERIAARRAMLLSEKEAAA